MEEDEELEAPAWPSDEEIEEEKDDPEELVHPLELSVEIEAEEEEAPPPRVALADDDWPMPVWPKDDEPARSERTRGLRHSGWMLDEADEGVSAVPPAARRVAALTEAAAELPDDLQASIVVNSGAGRAALLRRAAVAPLPHRPLVWAELLAEPAASDEADSLATSQLVDDEELFAPSALLAGVDAQVRELSSQHAAALSSPARVRALRRLLAYVCVRHQLQPAHLASTMLVPFVCLEPGAPTVLPERYALLLHFVRRFYPLAFNLDPAVSSLVTRLLRLGVDYHRPARDVRAPDLAELEPLAASWFACAAPPMDALLRLWDLLVVAGDPLLVYYVVLAAYLQAPHAPASALQQPYALFEAAAKVEAASPLALRRALYDALQNAPGSPRIAALRRILAERDDDAVPLLPVAAADALAGPVPYLLLDVRAAEDLDAEGLLDGAVPVREEHLDVLRDTLEHVRGQHLCLLASDSPKSRAELARVARWLRKEHFPCVSRLADGFAALHNEILRAPTSGTVRLHNHDPKICRLCSSKTNSSDLPSVVPTPSRSAVSSVSSPGAVLAKMATWLGGPAGPEPTEAEFSRTTYLQGGWNQWLQDPDRLAAVGIELVDAGVESLAHLGEQLQTLLAPAPSAPRAHASLRELARLHPGWRFFRAVAPDSDPAGRWLAIGDNLFREFPVDPRNPDRLGSPIRASPPNALLRLARSKKDPSTLIFMWRARDGSLSRSLLSFQNPQPCLEFLLNHFIVPT